MPIQVFGQIVELQRSLEEIDGAVDVAAALPVRCERLDTAHELRAQSVARAEHPGLRRLICQKVALVEREDLLAKHL